MKAKWDTLMTVATVICALITTALVVRREFAEPPPTAQTQHPVFIRDWKSHLGKGVPLGPPGAPVQVIELADFECPYCGAFHETMKALRERYPTQVSLVYVHFPLPGHRFALPAARVAECAADQGRFEAMYDQLFEEQQSFGLKPWTEYASAAGVPDLATFETCVKKTEPLPRVRAGQRLASKLDIRATPTLIINGWQLVRPPSVDELDGMVKAVLAGKDPVPRDRG